MEKNENGYPTRRGRSCPLVCDVFNKSTTDNSFETRNRTGSMQNGTGDMQNGWGNTQNGTGNMQNGTGRARINCRGEEVNSDTSHNYACGGDGGCLDEASLAYVYAPSQKFRLLYSAPEALAHGTLFEELYKPKEVYGRE